jgi:lipopolysaccharide transport system permease protein
MADGPGWAVPAMASSSLSPEAMTTTIRPTSGWVPPRLGELWHNRQLLVFFAWRDLKVRYAQTALGAAWTVLQPLALMLVFTLAFRKIGRVETAGVPYPVFVLAGLTFWTFFSRSLLQSSDSLVTNIHIVTKSSCPRLVLPISPIVSGLFDFTLTFVFFLAFAVAYGEAPGAELLALPAILALGTGFLAGLGLLLSAVNARFRDVKHVLPFSMQVWLFLSPVAFPIDVLGETWQRLLALNPLVGMIEAFRWSLVGTSPPGALELGLAVGVSLVTLAAGLAYFARAERTIADLA